MDAVVLLDDDRSNWQQFDGTLALLLPWTTVRVGEQWVGRRSSSDLDRSTADGRRHQR